MAAEQEQDGPENDRQMPLVGHLTELRQRLLNSILATLILFLAPVPAPESAPSPRRSGYEQSPARLTSRQLRQRWEATRSERDARDYVLEAMKQGLSDGTLPDKLRSGLQDLDLSRIEEQRVGSAWNDAAEYWARLQDGRGTK